MKIFLRCCFSFYLLTIATYATSQIKISGSFIARTECPAYQSFRNRTNPGDINTEISQSYRLVAKNKEPATHYQIITDAQPKQRWVAASCGEITAASNGRSPLPNQSGSSSAERYILAVSWQPGFCETRPSKPECISQTENRFDASNFTLHGLWPQPRSNIYCNVAANIVSEDRNNNWNNLPALTLNASTRQQLKRVMPGTQSSLHRHEWVKHGTCYNGKSEEDYFKDSIKLLSQLNSSAVRDLFANNMGETITATQIHTAFDNAFGQGAGDKIKIICKNDGNRRLITEITIAVNGKLDELTMMEAMHLAPNANNVGCTQGVVDPVGLQ